MARTRSTLLLAVWAVLLVIAGAIAAATHTDDKKVTAGGRPGQPTTSSTQPGETTTTGVASGGDPNSSTGATGDTGQSSSGDNPVVDSGNGGGGGTTPGRIMPTPGTYTVSVSGTSSLNGTPQSVPSSGSYTIRQINDTDQETTGDLNVVLRWTAESASLVRLTVTQLNKTFEPNPPVLFAPFPGSVGQTWEWTMTSTDGKTTVHQVAVITGTDIVDIGGQQVSTFVVQSNLEFSGDLTGTVQLTSWASPDYRLSVKQHSLTDVRFGLFRAQSDITSVLVSLTPS